MNILLSTTFEITPVPWQRVALWKGRLITPKETRKYEKAIGNLARDKMGARLPFNEPLQVDLFFALPRPDRFRKRPLPDVVCDIDNLVKSTLDGLNKIVWADDRRIVQMYTSKKWSRAAWGTITLRVWGGIQNG